MSRISHRSISYVSSQKSWHPDVHPSKHVEHATRDVGIQDLAKSRALLKMTGELCNDRFQVLLQPRAGLDYFKPDPEEAKAQLAAVTCLMDDIDPLNTASPPLIHVVSYSEASHLATPTVIDESIRITLYTLKSWREARRRGDIENMSRMRKFAGVR